MVVMAMENDSKQRVKLSFDRRRKAGFKRIHVWVPDDGFSEKAVKLVADSLVRKFEESNGLELFRRRKQ
jgi:hypothetical protein